MDNSIYTIDNQLNAVKQEVIRGNFARSAQSARPQIEINSNSTSATGNERSPAFTNFVYEEAPELLQAGCTAFTTERQRDMFLTSALTVLSGCFNTVVGLYDGKLVNANMFCFLVAPPASDKSVMNWARELGMGIHTRLTAENEAANKNYKAEMVQYKSVSKAFGDTGVTFAAPVEPVRNTLFVPANSSSAAIMGQIQKNNGSGIICETEADTLTNTFKQEWGNFDELLRKAFHQEMFSYARKTNNELVEVPHPKIAVALSGTPGQVGRLLVSNENGLVSRFMFYYSDTPAIWRDVSPKGSVNLGSYFQPLAERVFEIYNKLKDVTIEFELTDSQWDIHYQIFKSKLVQADVDMSSAVLRLGIIAFKIAMVLTILRNEKQLPGTGKLACADFDFRIALLLTEAYQKHADFVYTSLLTPKNKSMDMGKMKFFESLPSTEQFQRKDAVAIGEMFSIAERTVGKYIQQLCDSGLLVQVKYGTYMKM